MNNLDGTDHWLSDYYDGQDAPTEEEEQESYNLREQLVEAQYEDGEDF